MSSCCSTSAPAPGGRENLLDGTTGADMTTCPVMTGTPVNFCCAGCGPAFDADPAKHAAAMA